MKTIEELVAILLTVDGKGRETKREALVELISNVDIATREKIINETKIYRSPKII